MKAFAIDQQRPEERHLIRWILSRAQLFLGKDSELVFGGRDFEVIEQQDTDDYHKLLSSIEHHKHNDDHEQMENDSAEVDGTRVFNKDMKLNTSNGQIIRGSVSVYEIARPWGYIILVDTEYDSLRVDVFMNDIGKEMVGSVG